MLLASIPSPSFNEISIGPLDIHVYGLLIGIGVVVAAVTMTRRYAAWGGDPDIGLTYEAWCYDVPAAAIEFDDASSAAGLD